MQWIKLLLLAFGLAAPTQAELVKQTPVGLQRGVTVQKLLYTSEGLQVSGMLFVPPTPTGVRRPVVIFCHDGISGISREHRLSSLRLAKAGYVVFAPSYRGEDDSQGQVEVAKGEVDDALAAIDLMSSVPEADPNRIAMAGASHGALVSVLAAARDPRIKAVVSAYGVLDIYEWWDYLKRAHKLGNDAVTRRTYGDGPKARPQSFAMRHALNVVPELKCPVLVLQGKKDDIVPFQQAQRFEQAMRAANKDVQVELYPDCLHGFLVYAPYIRDASAAERAQTEQSWKRMLAFLKEKV